MPQYQPVVLVLLVVLAFLSATVSSKKCTDGQSCYQRLHRFYCTRNLYTTNYATVINAVHRQECKWYLTAGVVATDSEAGCEGLVPVSRFGTRDKGDYFASTQEQAVTATQRGLVFGEIAFYCAPTQGLCGATKPLKRLYNPATMEHVYTIFDEEAAIHKKNGMVDDGIVCYAWPDETLYKF